MKNNKTILKSFLFSIFISSSFLSFGMEEKENIIFKGYINLSDKPMRLDFGSMARPSLTIELAPQTGKLTDFTVIHSPERGYGKFTLTDEVKVTSRLHPLSGKHKQFIIVQTGSSLLDYKEIPIL